MHGPGQFSSLSVTQESQPSPPVSYRIYTPGRMTGCGPMFLVQKLRHKFFKSVEVRALILVSPRK